jgi:hypothetical protein
MTKKKQFVDLVNEGSDENSPQDRFRVTKKKQLVDLGNEGSEGNSPKNLI